MAKRQLTEAAQAAAQIRKELKKNGIKARVTSQTYSMGSSVNVDLRDELPATIERVREFCGQYKQGHFDSMQDLYEYSNARTDIPQAKHVFVDCTYSDDVKQRAWNWIRSYFGGYETAPEDHRDADQFRHDATGDYGNTKIRMTLQDERSPFWTQEKPRQLAA